MMSNKLSQDPRIPGCVINVLVTIRPIKQNIAIKIAHDCIQGIYNTNNYNLLNIFNSRWKALFDRCMLIYRI